MTLDVDRDGLLGGLQAFRSRYDSIARSRKAREFTHRKTNLVGLGIVLLLLCAAMFAPLLAPYDPYEQDISERLEPPSLEHPMGTDQLGRDLFSRILYGARVSLKVSLMVVGLSVLIGTVMGVVAGYAGGWVDEAIMRFVDLLMAFPGILFALVIVAVLGPSLVNLLLALTVTGWMGYARIIRGEVLSVKEDEYVKAAQLMGASRPRIMGRHIIPNVIGPIVVLVTLNLGGVVLGTAGLSFLGFGAQPPTPEWGSILAQSRNLLTTAWWMANFPGMAIMLTVFGFNLLGDGLRDVLDPRDIRDQRGSGL